MMKTAAEKRALTLARRAEHAIDAPKAMQDYRAAEQTVRDRTKHLRAQRLARESAR